MNLRPYQQAAVESIEENLNANASTLCVMPTGTGKTIVFAHLIDRVKGRVMILAHRKELVRQAANKVKDVTGSIPDIEMGIEWAQDGLLEPSKVIVSSIQTQISGVRGAGRMSRFDPKQFGLLVIDEAHHAAATSWREVIGYYRRNPHCKVVGFTATPDRADEQALGQVFESVAYRYELLQAITDGYLVPIRQSAVYVDSLDFSKVRTTAGDLNGADLSAVLEYEQNLHGIATPALERANGRKTLVFAASRTQGQRLTEIFNRHSNGCAAFVDCETPADGRDEIFGRYRDGKIRILVNVGIATEGWDEPGVEVVVMARPTKSRALYAQMVGRGTRPLSGVVDGHSDATARCAAIAFSPKPYLEVIDFVGNAGRHTLVSTADILGGFTDAVRERLKKARSKGETISVDVILQLKQTEAALLREEQEREEERQRKGIVATADYRVEEWDPFNVLKISPLVAKGWDRVKKPTTKMLEVLKNAGVPTKKLSFTTARQLIGEINRRRDQGHCSFKQAKVLRQYGYDTNASFVEAQRLIGGISANGWRKPDDAPQQQAGA